MKNIAFYITTHGYGHATRSIAIIRDLIKNPEFNVTICSNFPDNVLRKWFQPNSVKFHKSETLFRIKYEDFIQVNLAESLKIFKEGYSKRQSYIDGEYEYCKNSKIDLIISDICPFPFDVAHKLNIPSIAISNFSWYSIFKHIATESNLKDYEDIESLKNSYEKADILFRLPFSIDMDYFKEIKDVTLVVRKLTRNRKQIRDYLNIVDEDFLIFFGLTDFKFSGDKLVEKFNQMKKIHPNLTILFSSFLKSSVPEQDYFKFISDSEQESQDYLNASNVVVGKTGYGTVSECVAYEKPLIYTTRKNFIEDIALSDGIETHGRGKFYWLRYAYRPG